MKIDNFEAKNSKSFDVYQMISRKTFEIFLAESVSLQPKSYLSTGPTICLGFFDLSPHGIVRGPVSDRAPLNMVRQPRLKQTEDSVCHTGNSYKNHNLPSRPHQLVDPTVELSKTPSVKEGCFSQIHHDIRCFEQSDGRRHIDKASMASVKFTLEPDNSTIFINH
jgi:hypothetical protein